MRSISLKNVSKVLNGQPVLTDVSLHIPAGKFFALLGPSGCGKTTLLRLIGGFESVTSGSIYMGDEEITHVPTNRRRINTVFQQYALFPHLTVFENVAYGLRVTGQPKDQIAGRVLKVLRSVHLENHANKNIKQLSGGQQQRVAIARAVVNEPEVLLLDESLAALDFNLREKMLIELMELQEKLQITFMYVTHDQMEALTVADQMAIMNHDGEIEQIGTPKEIYEFPASSFVAKFVGNTNLIQGVYQTIDGVAYVHAPDLGLFQVYTQQPREFISGAPVLMSIRPEKIMVSTRTLTGFSNMLEGFVQAIVYHGRSTQYNVRIKNGRVVQVFEQNEEHFPKETIDYDSRVFLYWQRENVVLLER